MYYKIDRNPYKFFLKIQFFLKKLRKICKVKNVNIDLCFVPGEGTRCLQDFNGIDEFSPGDKLRLGNQIFSYLEEY